jgi:hypothetical protein
MSFTSNHTGKDYQGIVFALKMTDFRNFHPFLNGARDEFLFKSDGGRSGA